MTPTYIPLKSHASAWLFAALINLAWLGCKPRTSTQPHPLATLPFTPIQMNADTTTLYLGDFTGTFSSIDSVKWEDGSLLPIVQVGSDRVVRLIEQPRTQIGFLQLWSGSTHAEIPVFKTTKEPIEIKLTSFQPLESVKVIGSFTNWQANPIAMDRSRGYHKVDLMLDKGMHQYQLIIDGVEQPDPSHMDRVSNGFGGLNSLLQVGSDAPPLNLNVEYIPSANARSSESSASLLSRTAPNAYFYAWWNNNIYGYGQADSTGVFSLEIPAGASGEKRSYIRIWTSTDSNKSQAQLIPLNAGQPVTKTDQLDRHDWHTMIMYFLIVDRFKNGDSTNDWKCEDPGVHSKANHHGGDFSGIKSSLDYIHDLGANTIWVSPITPNPDGAWGYWSDPTSKVTSKFSSYHGYWPIASTGTDRRFGTMHEFNDLVDAIHERRQNILIDYVANHVHEEHPIYQEHPDWVTNLYLPDGSLNTQLWDKQRLTTWFDTFMPTLDLERTEVYQTMTDSAVWWIENTHIDGFRHDATKHIPEVFWRTLTLKVRKKQCQPIFQIGETYGAPELIRSYLSNGMLNSQFDFNLYDALVAAFTSETANISALIDVANQSLDTYGAHHLMGNITGNQDRPRFTSIADGSLEPGENTKFAGWTRAIEHQGSVGYQKMSWLMAFLMSSPGIPCIYYGDEIADVGGNDPDNRRVMRFDGWNEEEAWIHQWTKKWIALRKERMSMLYGQTSYSEMAPGLLAIHRNYLNESTWVLINTTEQTYDLALDTDEPLKPLIGTLEATTSGGFTLQAGCAAAFDVCPRVRLRSSDQSSATKSSRM